MLISIDGQSALTAQIRLLDYSAELQERLLGVSEAFESSVHPMSEIPFGTFVYPAKKVIRCFFIRAKEEFVAEGLSPYFVGRGVTVEAAKEDFCEQVHAGIQELIYKRPFELTTNDKERWKTINDAIDITVFKNRTPLVVQQYGVVGYGMLSRPCKITWDNGYTESIDLRQVHAPDFINYVTGQPIRALVRRDPVSRSIIDIPYIEKVSSLRSPKQIEESGFFDQLGDPAKLPESDWD